MGNNYQKRCYDDNPHYKIHYTLTELPQHSTPPHLHYDTSLVLMHFIKGSGNIHVEGKLYQIEAGDVVILNPNEIHVCTIDSNKPNERISLYINNSILNCFDCKTHTFFDAFYKRAAGIRNLIPANVIEDFGIGEQLQKILSLTEKGSTEGTVLAICAIIELLSILNQTSEAQLENDTVSPSDNKQINEIIRYLSENYNKKISIETIAEKFHFNKYHLCRLFKQYTGTTIGEFCLFKKLIAFNQLICQNHSLESACYQVGFQNYSNFFRLYKKHMGITPSEYKRSLQKK